MPKKTKTKAQSGVKWHTDLVLMSALSGLVKNSRAKRGAMAIEIVDLPLEHFREFQISARIAGFHVETYALEVGNAACAKCFQGKKLVVSITATTSVDHGAIVT